MARRNDKLLGSGGIGDNLVSTVRQMRILRNLACANDTALENGTDGSSATAPPFRAMRDVWPFLVYPSIPQWFVLPLGTDRVRMDHDLSRIEVDDRNAFYRMFFPSRPYFKGQKYFRHLIIPLFHPVETEHGTTAFLWSILHYDKDANLVAWYASSRWHRAAYMEDTVGFVERFPGPGLVESARGRRQRTPSIAHIDLGTADFRAYSLTRDNPRVPPRDIQGSASSSFWAAVHAVRHLMVRGTPGSDVPPFRGVDDMRLAKATMCLGINDFFDYIDEEEPCTMIDSRRGLPSPADEDHLWIKDALVTV